MIKISPVGLHHIVITNFRTVLVITIVVQEWFVFPTFWRLVGMESVRIATLYTIYVNAHSQIKSSCEPFFRV